MGLATGLCLLATADNAAVKCVCKRLCESLLSGLTGVYPEAESLPVQLFIVPRNCQVLLHSLTLMGPQHEFSLPLSCVLF